ncbi:MAG: omptin family outer membrane protease [bacterium]
MKNANRVGGMRLVTGVAVVGAVCCLSGLQAHAGNWSGGPQVGQGYWGGSATYSIGGELLSPQDGKKQLPDKISELKFPLGVVYVSLGGYLQYKDSLDIHGSAMVNVTDPSAKMEDSDWGQFEGSSEDTLDTYSESDAGLTAVAADLGVHYWFLKAAEARKLKWAVGVGPGISYQHLDWTLSNLDQWYPSHPRVGHDYVGGDVITYKSDNVLPYVSASGKLKFKQLSGSIEIGVGAAFVSDEDDHLLRKILATTDMIGFGVKGAAEIRYEFSSGVFVLAHLSALSITASGTEEDKDYGGEDPGKTWEIDHDYSLISANGGLAVGYAF